MDKVQIMDLLSPFIKGEVPKDKGWHKALDKVSSQISDQDIESAIPILRKMFHNPLDPNSKPEDEIPGAHGIYQSLTARRVSLRMKEGK